MANPIDLVSVVTNKLDNFREKDQQVTVAVKLREEARIQLAAAQGELNDYIKTVSSLATEITSELSSTGLAEAETAPVADSLKAAEPIVDETLKEAVEPAKTAVSDESPASEVKVAATGSKDTSARKLDEKPAPVDEVEEPDVKVTASKGGSGKSTAFPLSDDEEEKPVAAEKPVVEKTAAKVVEKPTPEKPAAKAKVAEAKAPSLGLWDDDDDDDGGVF